MPDTNGLSNTDVPLCLNRAREEMLMALGSDTAQDENAHRRMVEVYIVEAVHALQDEPERTYDWSELTAS